MYICVRAYIVEQPRQSKEQHGVDHHHVQRLHCCWRSDAVGIQEHDVQVIPRVARAMQSTEVVRLRCDIGNGLGKVEWRIPNKNVSDAAVLLVSNRPTSISQVAITTIPDPFRGSPVEIYK
jgi:hypothetical protein